MNQIPIELENTCPHTEEKKEYVKDYHQHWEGYEVTCSTCGKFIRWEQK